MSYTFFVVTVVVATHAFLGVRCDEIESNSVPSSRGIDTKSVLTSLASNLARGYVSAPGGSQVVSLNLTNLLVLVLLKALIFAAGSLGAGNWKGGYGRSADGDENLVTEDEMLMYLSYLTGSPGNNACLQSVACKRPQQANSYASAGEMLLRASKMIEANASPTYEYTLQEIREAVAYGASGADCNARYVCGNNKNKSNGGRR